MSLTIRLQSITTTNNFNPNSNPQPTATTSKPKHRLQPFYHSNPLAPLVSRHKALGTTVRPVRSYSTMIKSSLIDPDGGSLVNLVVPDSQRGLKTSEAESLPKVNLTKIDIEWVHVISEGWASPLRGFMREDEYLQSLHFNSLRMKDGSVVNMSLPIVLAIDDADKERIGASSDIALVGPNGNLVGVLRGSVFQTSQYFQLIL